MGVDNKRDSWIVGVSCLIQLVLRQTARQHPGISNSPPSDSAATLTSPPHSRSESNCGPAHTARILLATEGPGLVASRGRLDRNKESHCNSSRPAPTEIETREHRMNRLGEPLTECLRFSYAQRRCDDVAASQAAKSLCNTGPSLSDPYTQGIAHTPPNDDELDKRME